MPNTQSKSSQRGGLARALRRRLPRSMQRGFTLLEVMLATGLLAVGSVSVLVVLATAAGFASKRQAQQRLAQVLEEARYEALATVNTFRPSEEFPLPGGEGGVAPDTVSRIFAGYSYQLRFQAVDKEVPEAGYDVFVNVVYGDGQEFQEQVVVAADVIPDEEFQRSLTYEEQREGDADRDRARETR